MQYDFVTGALRHVYVWTGELGGARERGEEQGCKIMSKKGHKKMTMIKKNFWEK